MYQVSVILPRTFYLFNIRKLGYWHNATMEWIDWFYTSIDGNCVGCLRLNDDHMTRRCSLADCCNPLSWWSHQKETFSALPALCAGNSPVTGEFLSQRPLTRSFEVFFDLRRNERLSKQWWGWWFETPWLSLWRHRNGGSGYDKTLLVTIVLQRNTILFEYWQR